MHSIMSKDNKYVGQYLHIRDNEFSFRMFAKFYNLATNDNNFIIDTETARALIHTGKYYEPNKIYVNKPDSDESVLKNVNIDDYMVFIQYTNKIYIFNKKEFEQFMEKNEFHKDISTSFVLGIDNNIEFDNMKIIVGNTLETAKQIYMNRYKCGEPVCIGIMNNDHLELYTDKYKFSIPLIM